MVTGVELMGLGGHPDGNIFIFRCVRRRVRHLEKRKGRQAIRACRSTLGDFVGFHSNVSLYFSRVSTSLVRRCRARVHSARRLDHGAASFCVHVLHYICHGTINRKLTLPTSPFRGMCANISGASGETTALASVGRVGRLSLSSRGSLRFTQSVFLFSFCVQKVSFVSLTCLHGGSLGDNFIDCDHHGANGGLVVQ